MPSTESFDLARERVQDFIRILAESQGMETNALLFGWGGLREMFMPEHGLKLQERVCSSRVTRGSRQEVFTFTESAVRACLKDPSSFLLTYKDYILAGLRRLHRR